MFTVWSYQKLTLKDCQSSTPRSPSFFVANVAERTAHVSFTFLIDSLALNVNGCDTVAVKDYFTRTQSAFYVVERY